MHRVEPQAQTSWGRGHPGHLLPHLCMCPALPPFRQQELFTPHPMHTVPKGLLDGTSHWDMWKKARQRTVRLGLLPTWALGTRAHPALQDGDGVVATLVPSSPHSSPLPGLHPSDHSPVPWATTHEKPSVLEARTETGPPDSSAIYKARPGLEALTLPLGHPQHCTTPASAHPEGLGELLQGGEGEGVRPRLSGPAEATSELLVGTEHIGGTHLRPTGPRQGRRTTGRSQHVCVPKRLGRSTGQGAYPLHIRLSGGGLTPATSATRSPAGGRRGRLGIRTNVHSTPLGHLTHPGSRVTPHSIPGSGWRLQKGRLRETKWGRKPCSQVPL